MIPSRKLIRIIVRRFWGACAFLLISLAMVVALGRALSPQLNRYKDDLAQLWSEQLNVRVRIENMAVDWSGLSPELSLGGLVLENDAGQQVVSVEQALVKLNLIRSLVNRNLALDSAQTSNVSFDWVQNESGTWQFRGIPWRTSTDENFNIDDPLDIFLLLGRIDLSDVRFNLHYRDGGTNTIEFPRLVFVNSGDFHRLSSSIVIDDRGEAVSLVLEFRGDPRDLNSFSAKGYTRFEQVEVEKVIAALPAQIQTQDPLWRNRVATVESWFDIFAGGEVLFRGRLDIEKDQLYGDKPNSLGIQVPTAVGANFTGRLTSRGFWSVSVRDSVIDWESFQAPIVDFEISSQNLPTRTNSPAAVAPIVIRANQLELSNWLNTLSQAGLISAAASEPLRELDPDASLYNIVVTLQTNDQSEKIFDLRANFDEFNIKSWRGTPSITGIKGFASMQADRRGIVSGEMLIDSRNPVAMQFPTLYDQAMKVDQVQGQVNWRINSQSAEVDVTSGLLAAESPEGKFRGYFALHLPINEEPGGEELILQLGAEDSYVKFYDNYVPDKKVPQSLLDWLSKSIGGNGNVSSAGFMYRGGISSEGFANAAMQLFADVENTDLNYNDAWPPLRNISGRLWLNELAVAAEIDRGKVLNSDIQTMTFTTTGNRDASQEMLSVSALIEGDASDGLQVLRSDVFVPVINHQMDEWRAQGVISTRLDLLLPFGEGGESLTTVAVAMDDVNLELQNLNIDLFAIKGTIEFDNDRSLYAEDIRGQFLGREVVFNIEEDQSPQQLNIRANGFNSVEVLLDWANIGLAKFAKGDTQFDVAINLPRQTADSSRLERPSPTLTITSNLEGVSIDLPAPFNKAAKKTSFLALSAPLGGGYNDFRLNYENSLYGIFQIGSNGFRRGVLSTDVNPLLPEKYQLVFAGQLSEFKFEAWRATIEKYFVGLPTTEQSLTPRPLPLVFDLQLDTLSMGELALNQVAVNGDINNGTALFNIDSETVSGYFKTAGIEDSLLEVRLKHLVLPKSKPKVPTWNDIFFPASEAGDALANINPSELPPLDVAIDTFKLGENNLGAWSFTTRPIVNGLLINDLRGTFAEGQLRGKEGEGGARLSWINSDAGVRTQLNGSFLSNDLAAVMQKFEQPQSIASESANFDFDLSWPGAPTSISTTGLIGEVELSLTQGSFPRAGEQTPTDALLQLISIFNFDTWLRRLRLDFSDLGRSGMAFDNISGLIKFEQGNVLFDQPIIVQTQSGEFQLTGRVDLGNDQLDAKLIATLPMGGNLAFLAALVGSLPAAAGVWVVSKILDEQINRVSTLSYRIDGSLQDPNVEFDRLFEDKDGTKAAATQ